MKDVIRALREEREQSRLTLRDVGERLGVSSQAVGAWERGTREPEWEDLVRWGRCLGLQISMTVVRISKDEPTDRLARKLAELPPKWALLVEQHIDLILAALIE